MQVQTREKRFFYSVFSTDWISNYNVSFEVTIFHTTFDATISINFFLFMTNRFKTIIIQDNVYVIEKRPFTSMEIKEN